MLDKTTKLTYNLSKVQKVLLHAFTRGAFSLSDVRHYAVGT